MIQSTRRYLTILFLVSTALFFLDKSQAFAAIFDLASTKVVRPFIGAGTTVFDGSVSLFESVFLVRQFMNDYGYLRDSRDFYRGEYFKARSLKEENEFLRNALDLEGKGENQFILARVITVDPLRPAQELTIDKGLKDGIKEGQPVILAGQILVGQIKKVFTLTSRVLLITSQESRITGTLEGSQTNAIVTGSASGALIMELVLKDVELRRGEIVSTSGIEGDIPRNLLIGEVSKIVTEETASFKKAVVRPFFDSGSLRQVFVIRLSNK